MSNNADAAKNLGPIIANLLLSLTECRGYLRAFNARRLEEEFNQHERLLVDLDVGHKLLQETVRALLDETSNMVVKIEETEKVMPAISVVAYLSGVFDAAGMLISSKSEPFKEMLAEISSELAAMVSNPVCVEELRTYLTEKSSAVMEQAMTPDCDFMPIHLRHVNFIVETLEGIANKLDAEPKKES